MLRYIYGQDLEKFPYLKDTMFKDRRTQFSERLKWDVAITKNGHEVDQYDGMNPLYVIWEDETGRHAGSMRFLPTTGPTMVRDYFSHLNGNEDIQSPFIWECTRFCLGSKASANVAAGLMLAGGELMRAFSLTHLMGVFDERMIRIYRAIGSEPEVLGHSGEGKDRISLGLWSFSDQARRKVLSRARITSAQSEAWFEQSFGHPVLEKSAQSWPHELLPV